MVMTLKLSQFKKELVLILFAAVFLVCASHLATKSSDVIAVKHQNLYLQPISGLDKLALLEEWPADKNQGTFLLEQFSFLNKNLLAEFRRCEKYGLYTMVDSTGSSTVTVTPELSSPRIRNDTLHLPMILKAYNKSEKRVGTVTISAFGLCPVDSTGTIPLQKLGKALADYRRRFPYKKIVALFYAAENSK